MVISLWIFIACRHDLLFGLPLISQGRDPSSVPTTAHATQDTFSPVPASPHGPQDEEGNHPPVATFLGNFLFSDHSYSGRYVICFSLFLLTG